MPHNKLAYGFAQRDQVAVEEVLDAVLEDLPARWIKKDGSFRSRDLLRGWDNVPMHRGAQSQMFRALTLLLMEERAAARGADSRRPS